MLERKDFTMKKFFALFLALMMVVPMVAMAEAVQSPAADAFASASTTSSFAQFALEGDDLMTAAQSQTGFYLICTTNPDGSPNAGVFIFTILKHEDKYYLAVGLAPNQTKANLEADGRGLAIYAALPEAGAAQYAVSGARIRFVAFEDQAIVDALSAQLSRSGYMFFEVTEVLPLG